MSAETFPSWRYGPDGEAMVCESADAVPDGWQDHPSKIDPLDHDADGKKGGSTSAGASEEIQDLRAAYKEKFGKNPFNGWDADTLRGKLG